MDGRETGDPNEIVFDTLAVQLGPPKQLEQSDENRSRYWVSSTGHAVLPERGRLTKRGRNFKRVSSGQSVMEDERALEFVEVQKQVFS